MNQKSPNEQPADIKYFDALFVTHEQGQTMALFHVTHTFTLENRNLFFLAGEVVDGMIRAGMDVHLRVNSGLALKLRIHSIEFARREGGEDVCLGIESDPELREVLRGFNIAGETVEVVLEDEKKS